MARKKSTRKTGHPGMDEKNIPYLEIFHSVRDAIVIVDRKGIFTDVNRETERITGYSREEIIGKTLSNVPFLTPESREQVLQNFRKRMEGEDVPPYQVTVVSKEKEEIPMEISATSLLREGKPAGSIAVVRDLRETRRLEHKIQQTEERYQNLFEHANDAILIVNNKGTIIGVNKKCEDLLHLSRDQLLNRHFSKVAVKIKDLSSLLKLFEQALQGEEHPLVEVAFTMQDGRDLIAEVSSSSFYEEGKVAEIVSIIRDVTERKTAEKMLKNAKAQMEEEVRKRTAELRKSEARYRSLVENATDAIIMLDKSGRFSMVNEWGLKRFGYTKEEVIGKHFTKLIPLKYVPATLNIFRKAMQGITSPPFELEAIHKDGHHVPVSLHGNLMRDEKGKIIGTFNIVRDITFLKKANRQVEETNRKLAEKNSQLEQLSLELTSAKKRLEIYSNELEENVLKRTTELELANEELNTSNQKLGKVNAELKATNEKMRKTSDELAAAKQKLEEYSQKLERQVLTGKEALTETQKRYAEVVENSMDGIIALDVMGRFTFANKRAAELTGYTQEELSGMHFRHLLPVQYLPKALYLFQRQLRGLRPIGFELEIRRKDHKMIPMEISGVAIRRNNKVVGVQVVARDITQRKKSEEAIRQKTMQLEAANEELKATTEELQIAKRDLEQYSKTLEQKVKERTRELSKSNRDLANANEQLAATNEEMESTNEELAATNEEMRATSEQLKEAKIKLEGYNKQLEIDVAKRTRELRKANTELEKANQELLKVDRMKDQFLSITSHELKTPLVPIKIQIQLLLEEYFGKLTPDQEKSLQVILRNTGRLTRLMDEILDISRIESGRMRFDIRKVKMLDIIQLVANNMQPLAKKKNIHFRLDLPRQLPVMEGDADRLTQVITDLTDNALKFTPNGGEVTIRASKTRDNKIRVDVKDTGIGIARKNHARVFNKFEQVDASITRKYGGTGLGLPIVKSLVELHGGTISLDSELGKGATFTVVLPLKYRKQKAVKPLLEVAERKI